MGIMEKKMETTIMRYMGGLGFPKIRGTYYNGESNGKENGQ